MKNDKWDRWFLGLAKYTASASKDPSTAVGAVIVDDKRRIVSLGYNGFPAALADDDRLNDRDLKNKMTIHAEMNAIAFANRPLQGCTIYTWPFQPCSRCAASIIQYEFSRIVTVIPAEDERNARWKSDFDIATMMFQEANIELDFLPDII